MDSSSTARNHSRAIAGKIVIAGLLACAAIAASVYISKITFGRILYTVDKLATPNRKIQLVNTIFKEVVVLDQLQQKQAIDPHVQHDPLFRESAHVQSLLDSLHDMSLDDPAQVVRIDSMKKILYDRDLLFLRYLKLRSTTSKNNALAGEVKKLSELIETARSNADKNLVTTRRQTKTTIDTLDEDDKSSFLTRLFTRRKPRKVQKHTEEELNVRLDTITNGHKGDSLAQIGATINRIQDAQTSRQAILQQRLASLNIAGTRLIAQLTTILNDVEKEERQQDLQANNTANQIVKNSVINIIIILVLFIAAAIALIYRIFTDIARSNEYRSQLVIARDEAEAAGMVKQRFLANMSHELRTPLQTIVGVSEQIRTQDRPQPQAIENIYQSSLHLLQIVNEILDYSRIISGKYTLEHKPFNMHRLLHGVIEMMQVQATAKHLQLRYDYQGSNSQYYMGDPFRLKQILLNLLGNAIKFTDDGHVSLSVSEEPANEYGSQFTFTIRDTGVGMSAADMAVIFNEFEQAGTTAGRQGTGLGLTIVKTMVDMQQGTITADSEPGKGTTFTLLLTYAHTNNIADDEPPEQAATVSYDNHIWVVDDDKFILQLCDSILNKYGIPHTCFSSANKALATAFPPHMGIVFLDIRMAEMGGPELCRKLRERGGDNVPVFVALTAQALPGEHEQLLANGFDDLVVKPFLEQNFMSAIFRNTPLAAPQPLVLNFTTIIRMIGNDESLITASLQSFITETTEDVATIERSTTANDHNIAECLHRLAGRCGLLGLAPLCDRIRATEIAARQEQNTQHLQPQLQDICIDVRAVTHTIQYLIDSGSFLQSVGKTNTFPVANT